MRRRFSLLLTCYFKINLSVLPVIKRGEARGYEEDFLAYLLYEWRYKVLCSIRLLVNQFGRAHDVLPEETPYKTARIDEHMTMMGEEPGPRTCRSTNLSRRHLSERMYSHILNGKQTALLMLTAQFYLWQKVRLNLKKK